MPYKRFRECASSQRVGIALILLVFTGFQAQANPVTLGQASSFAVLAGSTVTNAGLSVITGNLGVSPGTAITGFGPGVVTGGTIHSNDAIAVHAHADLATAYNVIAGETVTHNLTGQNLGGLTLTPGVYHFNTSAQLTGALTLDAQGDPNARFDFQIGSTLTTAPNATVTLTNSGSANNVYWQVGSSATLDTSTAFKGNILAFASITLTHGVSNLGRVLALNGGVTMDTNNMSAPVSTGWRERFNVQGKNNDNANAMAMDSAGNVYVTGWSFSNSSDTDYMTIKYDANGNQIWAKRYNGPGNGADAATAIAVDSAGNVYVTGTSFAGAATGNDYATIKYDTNGNSLWHTLYNGPGNGNDIATALAIDSVGNVYVTGASFGGATAGDFATVKYDTNGHRKWTKRYNGPGNGNDTANALALDGAGNVYVTGWCTGTVSGADYMTIKYDTNGNQKWTRRYNGTGNGTDQATSIAVDSAGNVYVTGTSFTGAATGNDYATIKYNTNGNSLWHTLYNGPGNGNDIATALAIDSVGNVYVTGASFGGATAGDFATVKYDTNGHRKWAKRYNGPGNGNDGANAIAVDSVGNTYVTGWCTGSGSGADYMTIEYDTNGTQKWARRYNGTGNGDDVANAIVVDSASNVYITGTSFGGTATGHDDVTIKYTYTP